MKKYEIRTIDGYVKWMEADRLDIDDGRILVLYRGGEIVFSAHARNLIFIMICDSNDDKS